MYWILSHGFMQWTSSKAFYRVLCVVVENKNTCSGNGVSRVFLEQRSVDHVHATLLKEPCIVIGTSLLNWSKHWSHKKSSSSLIPTFCASPVQPSQQRILKTALSMSEMDGNSFVDVHFYTNGRHPSLPTTRDKWPPHCQSPPLPWQSKGRPSIHPSIHIELHLQLGNCMNVLVTWAQCKVEVDHDRQSNSIIINNKELYKQNNYMYMSMCCKL